MFKKLQFMSWLFSFLMIFLLISCDAQLISNNDKTIKDLLIHFEQEGISAKIAFQMLVIGTGANDGYRINLNGDKVENGVQILIFDKDVPKQKRILEETKAKGKFITEDWSMSAIVSGSFVMMDYEKHPDKDKIIKTFQSF